MKRTGLVNLICSLIALAVVMIAVIVVMMFCGSVKQDKPELVISSANATAIYSEIPLKDDSWELIDGKLLEGHRLVVNVSGVQFNPGISENYISAAVKDEKGNDVTRKYNITYKPGTLNVKARPITIIAESDMKLYDGAELIASEYTVDSTVSLLPGHSLNVGVGGAITEIGVAESEILYVTVLDSWGNDVTSNYSVQKKRGKLVVHSADSIVIESQSDQKYYDGKPLKNNGWTLVSGVIAEGHELKVQVTGSVTSVGIKTNDFSARIVDSQGKDVTGEYNIVKIPGELVVIKKPTKTG